MKLYAIVIMHLTRDGSALYSSCSATEYVRSGTRFVTWIILDHSKIGEKNMGCSSLEQCSQSLHHSIESWLVDRDSPFLDYCNPQYIEGSIIPN